MHPTQRIRERKEAAKAAEIPADTISAYETEDLGDEPVSFSRSDVESMIASGTAVPGVLSMFSDIAMGNASDIPAWGLAAIRGSTGRNNRYLFLKGGEGDGMYHATRTINGLLVARVSRVGGQLKHDIVSVMPEERSRIMALMERVDRFIDGATADAAPARRPAAKRGF